MHLYIYIYILTCIRTCWRSCVQAMVHAAEGKTHNQTPIEVSPLNPMISRSPADVIEAPEKANETARPMASRRPCASFPHP